MSAAFLAISLWLLTQGNPAGLVGLLGALFGLVGVTTFVVTSHSCLELDEAGFTIRVRSRVDRYRWADVAEFGLQRVGTRTFVGFDFSESYRGSRELRAKLPALIRPRFDMLLVDSYRMRAQELLVLLQQWKARHGGA